MKHNCCKFILKRFPVEFTSQTNDTFTFQTPEIYSNKPQTVIMVYGVITSSLGIRHRRITNATVCQKRRRTGSMSCDRTASVPSCDESTVARNCDLIHQHVMCLRSTSVCLLVFKASHLASLKLLLYVIISKKQTDDHYYYFSSFRAI